MVKVKRRQNESDEQLLRRFRKQVVKSRVLSDARRKRWHISKSELRRLKIRKSDPPPEPAQQAIAVNELTPVLQAYKGD